MLSRSILRLGASSITGGSITGTIAKAPLARRSIVSSRQGSIRLQSTSSAKGPSGPEASPQGSDKRGIATTYALPVVAASLVVFAFYIRLSSKDHKQNAVNVGIGTEGQSKLKGSKAKAIADQKASSAVDENIK